jgi:manganese efflux pump family protein
VAVAALVTWIITALGGFYLLATWIRSGGHRQPGTSRFPPALIFGHFALAAIGLVIWIIYVAADSDALAWIAFILLVPVALLGLTMFARWLPTYRQGALTGAAQTATASAPAERNFPVAVVAGHGVFAVVTVVLVLLTALGVGGS